MKESVRNKIALLLLLVYVPLMFTLEFTHNHHWTSTGKSCNEITSTAAGNDRSVNNDSVCSACLFSSGHVSDVAILVFGIGFEHQIALVSDLLIPFEFSLSSSARAPPSISLS